eukprot:TRINITY_DN2929_c1_g3_i2.p1 TRINITY_DN2929_c1_g3~~TRINITY_DN2929_c1_g3_i2.p1  ORF type:complete len:182 (-),score=58.76 TRINITY_DN2929_c1_g3_i2:9-554(-)
MMSPSFNNFGSNCLMLQLLGDAAPAPEDLTDPTKVQNALLGLVVRLKREIAELTRDRERFQRGTSGTSACPTPPPALAASPPPLSPPPYGAPPSPAAPVADAAQLGRSYYDRVFSRLDPAVAVETLALSLGAASASAPSASPSPPPSPAATAGSAAGADRETVKHDPLAACVVLARLLLAK